MTIHKSLRVKSTLLRQRSVWTRLERLQKLEADGKFDSEQSVFGLPKVRTFFKIKSRKAKPAEAAVGAEGTAVPAAGNEGTASPASGAKAGGPAGKSAAPAGKSAAPAGKSPAASGGGKRGGK